jgi:DNA polymerase-3 subunit epsilon
LVSVVVPRQHHTGLPGSDDGHHPKGGSNVGSDSVTADLFDNLEHQKITLVVIDFEAATPAGRLAEPIEVAAIALVVRGGRLVEDGRFEALIRPPEDVPLTARDLAHGITEDELQAAAPAAQVLGELDRLLTTPPYRLVAQHASVERNLIAPQHQHCPTLATTPLLDTVRLARRAVPGLASYGLDALLAYYSIPRPAQRHRAMPDVVVTAEVLRRLLADGSAAGHWNALQHLDAIAGIPPKRQPRDGAIQDALFASGRPAST